MADAAVQFLLEKLVTIVTDEIRLMFGVKTELDKLKKSLVRIQAFLEDAARREVVDATVKLWLKELENVAYQANDVLDEFQYETLCPKEEVTDQMKLKVCCLFSFTDPLFSRSKMGHKIRDVVEKVNTLYRQANRQGLEKTVLQSSIALPLFIETSSIGNDPIVVGRENDVSKVVGMLINPSEMVLSVLPVTGMGGLGKTTLARLIFKDPKIVDHFDETVWVCVSENFDPIELFNKMLKSLGNIYGHENVLEYVVSRLKEKLNGKRYLLILDDLWNENKVEWESFKNILLGISSNRGNFIITTTRLETVASQVTSEHIFCLGKLSDDDCWSIIKKKAFSSTEEVSREFVSIGMEIACKCGGLPLAASMIGATLKGKGKDVWTSILKYGLSESDDDPANGVGKILKISYDRLPSLLLKKCFTYCSIFRKDENLEKEHLVQLWMAEGLLGENGGDDMENKGNIIYDSLLQYSFFQEAVKDKYGSVEYSKMHHLVHDLAMTVSEGVSFNEENYQVTTSSPPQVRYLAVKSFDVAANNIREEDSIYLRSLVSRSNVSENNFKHLTHLRILHLRSVVELPSSIVNLIHLRLLDLSYTDITAIPESICYLSNLQTLRALYCFRLGSLPEQLNLLLNLRHIIVSRFGARFIFMPLGIRKLTCLRTLPLFLVGNEVGRRIDELGDLNHLSGKFQIDNLELVNNMEEAVKARLVEKLNIQELVLVWSNSRKGNYNKDQEVLEGLHPHQSLKKLEIREFRGENFPLWTMKMATLDNLIEISLVDCRRCQQIPTLGHLPQLKVLKISGLRNVESIGPSFYYLHDGQEMCPQEDPFPALESLTLKNMDNLATWTVAATTPQGSRVDGFPMLKYLEICHCKLLRSIPHHDFTHLQKLEIEVNNDSLILDITSNETTLMSLKGLNIEVAHQPNFSHKGEHTHLELPDESGESLKDLVIKNWQNLRLIKCTSGQLQGLTSLAKLEVSKCSSLASFKVDWKKMPWLEEVTVSECPNWKSMPRDIGSIHGLRKLHLVFTKHDFELASETLRMIRGLKSLEDLNFSGHGKWDSIPNQLQYLTTVTKLSLLHFGVKTLPEWLGNLSSLQTLEINGFKKLNRLASKETMQRLSKLEKLYIYDSPLLDKSCQRPPDVMCPDDDDSSEWYKISHIPHVRVNWVNIPTCVV